MVWQTRHILHTVTSSFDKLVRSHWDTLSSVALLMALKTMQMRDIFNQILFTVTLVSWLRFDYLRVRICKNRIPILKKGSSAI